MKFKQLTLTEDDGGFTVTAEGYVADHLGRDEALGCIASALFTDKMPMYMQTLAQRDAREAWHANQLAKKPKAKKENEKHPELFP